MRRYFLYIFLLIFIIGFLVLPEIGLAEINPEEMIENQDKIELKEKEGEFILLSLKQKFKNKWIEFPSPEEQAILVILSQVIKVNAMEYLLVRVPKETGKVVIKATVKVARLILAKDISLIIDEIEKITVQEAKKYLTDWLLQNELKTGKGNLEFSYPAYNGDWQKATFPYIIVYRPLGPNFGEIGINIYSSKNINTPAPRSSYQWEGGVEELPPFIVKINGRVEKVEVGLSFYYHWLEEPTIEVVFDEPVPEIEFAEPGFFDKLKSRFREIELVFERAMEMINIIFGKTGSKVQATLNKIGTIFSNLELFQAGIKPLPLTPLVPEIDISEINLENLLPVIEKIEEVEEKLATEIKETEDRTGELNLDEIQEMIDDISEMIDILTQDIIKLGQEQGIKLEIGTLQQEEEKIAEKEDLEEIVEREEEEEQKKIGQEGVGQEISIGGGGSSRSFYPKILISEIQISSIEERFIELYNPNTDRVNLSGWYIQRKTETGTSWNSLITSTQFEGKTIQAKSYFLISRALGNSDILLSDLTLTENNSLVLKNPNREIVDLVGWGQAQDYEAVPAGNPINGKSLGRQWSETSGVYIDTNNNRDDFEIQEPTPKAKNQDLKPETEPEPELFIDSTAPQVIFELESIQTSLSFTLSWTATDPISSVTPSGIDGFYLQYQTPGIETTSPSSEEGIVLWYNENNQWQDWPVGEILEFEADRENLQVLAKDEYTYNFRIQIRDRVGNLSEWQEASTRISLVRNLLINEVCVGFDKAENEFIEIYNPREFSIDLNQDNFKLKLVDSSNKITKKEINWVQERIPASGYFLFGAGELPVNLDAVYGGKLLSGASGVIITDKNDEIIDKVGWGEPSPSEAVEGQGIELKLKTGQSIERKILGLDTDDNSQDFEIKDVPTPTNSQGETFSQPSFTEAPWPMFQHDAQNTGRSPFIGPGISEEPEVQVLIEAEELGLPVIGSDATIYLKTKQGLSAFYPNGAQKWIYELSSVFGTPALWEPDKAVYVLSQEEGISAIDIRDGSLKWKKGLNILYSNPNQGPIIGDNGKIYFIAEDFGLVVLDKNGEQAWIYDFDSISNPVSNLVVDQGRNVYFGQDNTLFAVNSEGEKWRRTFETKCKHYTCQPRISTILIADDGTIYLMVYDEEDFVSMTDAGRLNCIHALNPEDPAEEQEKWPAICWRFSLIPIPISSQGNIYTSVSWLDISATPRTRIIGYDSQGNSLVNWQPPIWSWIGQVSSIILDKEENVYALFSHYDNTIKALSSNGEEKWSFSLDGQRFDSLSLGGDGTLFIPGEQKLFIIK